MSHVAEGDLHAYLDGALALYPPGEADRIRDHLEACAACRARLAEAEGVRERSAAVLERGAPGTIEAPPFEEIRRRARASGSGAPDRAGAWARRRRLAWVASVVVALGGGWLVGRAGLQAPPPTTTPAADLEPASGKAIPNARGPNRDGADRGPAGTSDVRPEASAAPATGAGAPAPRGDAREAGTTRVAGPAAEGAAAKPRPPVVAEAGALAAGPQAAAVEPADTLAEARAVDAATDTAATGVRSLAAVEEKLALPGGAVGLVPELLRPDGGRGAGRCGADPGAGGTVRGRLVALPGREPVAVTAVLLRAEGGDVTCAVRPDSTGAFELLDVAPGSYRLETGLTAPAPSGVPPVLPLGLTIRAQEVLQVRLPVPGR